MLKRLPISAVQPGMVITQITQQFGPVKIKKSGLVSSTDMVLGLAEMGIEEVEVDLDQTVEIESNLSSIAKQTQTQALLQAKHSRRVHRDDQSDDQHNRNLFLPSVQGIPSLWSIYFRQILIGCFTIILGVGTGYIAASPKEILLSFESAKQIFGESTDQASENAVDTLPNKEVTEPKTDSTANTSTAEEVFVEKPQIAKTLIEQSVEETTARNTYGGEVGVEITGTNRLDDATSISPELLRRFNKAVADLDSRSSADIGDITPPTEFEVEDDIQRIDQLPVKFMTTLPSMKFTAHIYASKEAERWVRVNGERLSEGDVIADKVQIIAIEPQRVVLGYQGEIFSMVALTDW